MGAGSLAPLGPLLRSGWATRPNEERRARPRRDGEEGAGRGEGAPAPLGVLSPVAWRELPEGPGRARETRGPSETRESTRSDRAAEGEGATRQ